MGSICLVNDEICGIQFNKLTCAGDILTGEKNQMFLSGNAIDALRWNDVFEPEVDKSSRCNRNYTRKKRPLYRNYSIDFCYNQDYDLLYGLLGLLNPFLPDQGPDQGCIAGALGYSQSSICPCSDCGEECDNPGVAVTVFHKGVSCAACCTTATLIPKICFTFAENEQSITQDDTPGGYTIEGRAEVNPNYGRGPGNILPHTEGIGCAPFGQGIKVDVQLPDISCSCGDCGSEDTVCGFGSYIYEATPVAA